MVKGNRRDRRSKREGGKMETEKEDRSNRIKIRDRKAEVKGKTRQR